MVNTNILSEYPNAQSLNFVDGSISAPDNEMTFEIPYSDCFDEDDKLHDIELD